MMGLLSSYENKNAHKLVQFEKKEENMTHGVDIYKFKNENVLLSIWDFAGKKIFYSRKI